MSWWNPVDYARDAANAVGNAAQFAAAQVTTAAAVVEHAAQATVDNTVKTVENTVKTVENTVQTVEAKAAEAVVAVQATVDNTVKTVENTVDKATAAVKDTANNVVNTVETKVGDIATSIKDAPGNMMESTKETLLAHQDQIMGVKNFIESIPLAGNAFKVGEGIGHGLINGVTAAQDIGNMVGKGDFGSIADRAEQLMLDNAGVAYHEIAGNMPFAENVDDMRKGVVHAVNQEYDSTVKLADMVRNGASLSDIGNEALKDASDYVGIVGHEVLENAPFVQNLEKMGVGVIHGNENIVNTIADMANSDSLSEATVKATDGITRQVNIEANEIMGNAPIVGNTFTLAYNATIGAEAGVGALNENAAGEKVKPSDDAVYNTAKGSAQVDKGLATGDSDLAKEGADRFKNNIAGATVSTAKVVVDVATAGDGTALDAVTDTFNPVSALKDAAKDELGWKSAQKVADNLTAHINPTTPAPLSRSRVQLLRATIRPLLLLL